MTSLLQDLRFAIRTHLGRCVPTEARGIRERRCGHMTHRSRSIVTVPFALVLCGVARSSAAQVPGAPAAGVADSARVAALVRLTPGAWVRGTTVPYVSVMDVRR
jgi:hypothetical protein